MLVNLLRNKMYILFVLAVFLCSYFFVFLRGQDINWDLQNYHFYTGYALLEGRLDIDATPSNLQSFFNPTVNVISYFANKYLSFPFNAWFICFFQSLSLLILAFIVQVFIRPNTTKEQVEFCLLYGLSALSPSFWSELGTSFFSSTLTPLILLSIYLSLLYIKSERGQFSKLICAGITMGVAVGFKLTNGPFAIALAFSLLLFTRGGLIPRLCSLFYYGVGGCVGFSLSVWWHIRLFYQWQSPLFPLYNNIFKSPFFGFSNARDMRWIFNSTGEFFTFIYNSFYSTNKTSEVAFADPRFLIFSVLLVVAVIAYSDRFKQAITERSRVIAFLLCLFFIGTYFWAVSLAYQRYFIPFEMVLGIAVYCLVKLMVQGCALRNLFLACICAITAVNITVPDWGHSRTSFGNSNPFEIPLKGMFIETPAKYLLIGVPVSYLTPFFNQGSYFYGAGLDSKLEAVEKISENRFINEHPELPLRILTKQTNSGVIKQFLRAHRLLQNDAGLKCDSIKNQIDSYLVCEITNIPMPTGIALDFSHPNLLNFGLLSLSGVSEVEPWGRWSNSDEVNMEFSQCFRGKHLIISLVAHSFVSNQNKSFILEISGKKVPFRLRDTDSNMTFDVDIDGFSCVSNVLIHVPNKKSPKDLGISNDSRPLGVGLVSMAISSK
jgi:hypothetical protein